MGHLHQISISQGGVPKLAVAEAEVRVDGVEGDRQRTPKVHGGPERAVCLFSLEIIEALRAEGHSIEPGASGENLTVAGVEWARVTPGVRVRVGERVVLEVTSYTAPCEHNARWFKEGNMKRISQKHAPGWSRVYARVLEEGRVRPGDAVVLEEREDVRRKASGT